jgi:hypothetical protein
MGMKKYLLVVSFFLFGISTVWSKTPIISFFNEMNSRELSVMFEDSAIIESLKKMHAEVRMGLVDLTYDRVQVVKKLNAAGIPVVAWLLLPEDEGYWFNSSNGLLAIKRYRDMKQWAEFNELEFKAIGIDLELDINDGKLIQQNPWNLFWMVPPRLYDKTEIEKGRREYGQLIETMQHDGYMVESYYASFIKDETAIGNTAIQQATKFLDIKTDKEIPMLYSSFFGNPDGYYKVYGSDIGLKAVGVGSTGGGVDTTLPTLSYEQLVHDISIASKFADEVHVFSLEGCVKKGFLTRLVNQQFDDKIEFDMQQVQSVQKLQKFVKLVSNVLSYPTIFFLSIFLIIAGVIWLIVFVTKKIILRIRKVSNNN